MNTQNHPHIEMVRTGSLKPNPRNARTHSKKQISQIGASIRQFGWLVPIVVDDENMIAAGHGRWLAAKELKLRKVPIIRAKFVSDADRRAFTLADNRIASLSGWDEDLLTEELSDLFKIDYEIGVTGFGASDLDFALVGNDERDLADPPAEDPPVEPVSQIGDLWLIGPHRIYNGDARDAASWEALLGDTRADMIFADPPYNVPIDGFVSGNGKNRHREFVMGAGEMSAPEFTGFLRSLFRKCVRFSRNGSIHYHCMDWRHIRELLDAADGVYSEHKQLVVWDKQNGGQGGFYRNQHELVFVFKSGNAKHTNNFGLGETGRYRTNIVQYAGANSFRKGRDEDLAAHSTVKPTALIVDFLLDCSNRGELVVDCCLGSGSTLLAAEHTGRRGAGIELDPGYVDVAIDRLTKASGLEAVLDADGRSFSEVAMDRLAGAES